MILEEHLFYVTVALFVRHLGSLCVVIVSHFVNVSPLKNWNIEFCTKLLVDDRLVSLWYPWANYFLFHLLQRHTHKKNEEELSKKGNMYSIQPWWKSNQRHSYVFSCFLTSRSAYLYAHRKFVHNTSPKAPATPSWVRTWLTHLCSYNRDGG